MIDWFGTLYVYLMLCYLTMSAKIMWDVLNYNDKLYGTNAYFQAAIFVFCPVMLPLFAIGYTVKSIDSFFDG